MVKKEFFPVLSLYRNYLEEFFNDEESKKIIKELTDNEMESIADELREILWDSIEDFWEDALCGILIKYVKDKKKIK